MSRSSDLGLSSVDSQVLGSIDSISAPSEPPDIRNWFSSYVYESPELNTLDSFQDFGGYAENLLGEEAKAKFAENWNFGKHEAGAGVKESANAVVKRSDEFENGKPAAVVSGLSESVSQCSEPPDIKNWFSSYLYQSPLLDGTEAFTITDYKEKEEDRLCNDQRTCTENNMDVKSFTGSTDLPCQNGLLAVVSKCSNLIKDTKLDNHSICKDSQHVDLKAYSSTLVQKTSERVSQQILPELIEQTQNHGTSEKTGNMNQHNENYDAKFSCKFTDKSSRSLNIGGTRDGKSLYKSIERKDCIEDDLEKEDLYEHKSPKNLDLVALEGNSGRRPTAGSIGKENKDSEIPGSGFISTRKNRRQQTNNVNVEMPSGVCLESPRIGGKHEADCEKDTKIRRKVLSDTTNFHSLNVVESTGKWRCPQKYKPNIGPPLKQLRLEQWVRRV